MKALLSEGKFEAAAEIADTINWNKIKNVNALVKAGEVYEKVGRYEDSREILLNAYDRSPIGRTIIYHLAEVAIKMEDYEGAKEYYDEFVDIAPHDNQRYILKYNIKKAQGASYNELIPILEEFKDQEYTEEWAFELAHLYHKAGMIDKCVDACDELILWFGDGPFVEHSLELKMLYQPLTKMQEEKYRQFLHEKEGRTVIGAAEMERAGEYIHDTVVIPQVTLNPSRFNTTNLQEEIVKGMQQIMDATEKESVVGTMDNIKKLVEEIPYLQLPTEEELAAKESATHIETDEEIDGSLRINFQELLGEESDGQISLVMKEKAQLEQQITGQMSIADVLEEWEKTKRAAEAALQEAEQRKLESAKARALQEAEDIMDRLNDVIPRIEAESIVTEMPVVEPVMEEEVMPVIEPAMEPVVMPVVEPAMEPVVMPVVEPAMEPVVDNILEAGQLFESMNSILDREIARLSAEKVEEDSQMQETEADAAEVEAEECKLEDSTPETNVLEETNLESEEPEVEDSDEEILEEEILELEIPEVTLSEETQEEIIPEPVKEEKPLMEQKTIRMPEIALPIIEDIEEILAEEEKAEKQKQILCLTEEQKAIFSYFVPVKGMEDQLCKALSGIVTNYKESDSSAKGNLIIQGCQGCGKTVLATSIIKVLQKECGHPNGRIGKIDAAALNKKDVQQLLRKVAGGCLIIERAGEIDRATAVTLSLLLEQDNNATLIILEDTAAGIKKALATDDGFAKKFDESVTVPIFTNDELVVFAKSYASELGYEIDAMAILALHNRISNIEKLDQATTLVEVKEIIDEAIEREANGGIRKAFNILTAKRYTDDDKIVLTERDFE